MRWWSVLLLVLVIVLVAGAALMVVLDAPVAAPASAALRFPWTMLSAEASTMNECVECHEPDVFHTCETCHDEHGSAALLNVPFDDLIMLSGDFPEPGYVAVNEILPYRDQPGAYVGLLDFLAERGVGDFQTVTLTSRDEGFVTLYRDNLTAGAMLLPHTDGVRFAAEELHVSTWLKGVWRMILVGSETPLTIDGQATSIGRLLLGPTRSVTVEETEVMLKSETDGQIRRGRTAARIEGAPVEELAGGSDFQALVVRDAGGGERTLTAEEARGGLLAQLGSRVTLVLPGRGRSEWIGDVVAIEMQR
ncbi:MAG: hypothetical protein GX597_14145 [Anaerolineaceae bacterium]|nr:hypothetical protein [Anaerolineaceae bacterium]